MARPDRVLGFPDEPFKFNRKNRHEINHLCPCLDRRLRCVRSNTDIIARGTREGVAIEFSGSLERHQFRVVSHTV